MSPETDAVLKWATLAIAVVGAVLGLINTWRTLSSDRVRLRVRIRVTLTTLHRPAIELVNLSTFPVTVIRAGWVEKRRPWALRNRLTRVTPADAMVGEEILANTPFELLPRRPVVIKFESEASASKLLVHRRAFVTTACGTTAMSSRLRNWPVLRISGAVEGSREAVL